MKYLFYLFIYARIQTLINGFLKRLNQRTDVNMLAVLAN